MTRQFMFQMKFGKYGLQMKIKSLNDADDKKIYDKNTLFANGRIS